MVRTLFQTTSPDFFSRCKSAQNEFTPARGDIDLVRTGPPREWHKQRGGDHGWQKRRKTFYPQLGSFYETWRDISFTLVRIVVGVIMVVHVWGKFKVGAGAVATNAMTKYGLEPALGFAYAAMFLESVGGVCLIIGLFTRFLRRRWRSKC